jgi:hypothetical protein
MKSSTAYLGLLAAFVTNIQAGLRFPCSSLTTQRLDPAAEPGALPSAHLHMIVGGNAFNATMTGDVSERATCTTCQMAEDFSNYWVAHMFFKDPKNGTYHRVMPKPVQPLLGGSNGAQGGLTVYYTQFDLSRDNVARQPIKAFPPGFRMTVGSPTITNKPHAGLSYQCMSGSSRGTIVSSFPAGKCNNGIFTTHHFPPCWDGKNLDSPNHQDHMYNTVTSEGFTNAPACPSSHPIRVPQVTFEIEWDTVPFNSLWDPAKDKNPFMWSFEGAASGAGTHADYMFGWKGDSLQRAMDKSECFYDGCGVIKKQAMAEANKCTVKDFVKENIDGWQKFMPGQGEMKTGTYRHRRF